MKDYINMSDKDKEKLIRRAVRLANKDQKKLSDSFTEEEKWEDPNSLDPIDYNSDEQYIRSRIQIALGIIAFACLAIYLIIK